MKKRILWTMGTLILALFLWIGCSEAAVSDISENLLRLHILANSDSEEDQALKLKLRDHVLALAREEGSALAQDNLEENLPALEEECRRYLRELGASDDVRAELGRFYFPTKQYENIILPAGEYRAVRLVIGEGKGKNWWCVMYPPLCFTNGTKGALSEEELNRLKAEMSRESFQMIQAGEEKITLKPALKIVEWWQEAKHALLGR